MVRAEEIPEAKTTVEFMLPLTDTTPGPTTETATSADLAIGSPILEADGIVLSGTQVLWSCFSALSFVGLLLWAILKLWVYE